MHANSRTCRIPVYPIGADVAFDDLNKLVRNDTEGRFPHDFPSTLVLGQSVIEGDLFIAEASLLTARPCCSDVLGKLDQFLKYLGCRDRVRMVPGNRCVEAFRK